MKIRECGDSMLLVEFEASIDPVVNERAIALARRLRARQARGVRDVVPAYCTVGVHFDPLQTDLAALERASSAMPAVAPRSTSVAPTARRDPVRYGGDDGPDLEALPLGRLHAATR